MRGWREALLPPEATIRQAMECLDRTGLQIALAVDAQGRLLGTVSDGDVRRGILGGLGLDEPVGRVLNPDPVVVPAGASREEALSRMRAQSLHQIPRVDEAGRVTGLDIWKEMLSPRRRPNRVVLMAGGEGQRLRPLTDDRPKPLLEVGHKPVLETILEMFAAAGFRRFTIAVNYKAEMIREHFGDGARWGVDIDYVVEPAPLGTAGALGLLDDRPQETCFVMNGDLLTTVHLDRLLEFHLRERAAATMCVRQYELQVPYGVVRTEGHEIRAIDEKPVHPFFVNAGVYVLEPEALEFVPRGERFDMTSLFSALLSAGRRTAAFPLREYWLDIGRMDDFERAKDEYADHFPARPA